MSWFVVNVADADWVGNEKAGRYTRLGDTREDPFPQLGINIQVVDPGQPSCLYHRENMQEDFLVLHGECLLLVDGEERFLKQWDFFHCPPEVDHVFVGAGTGPCAILMVGARGPDEKIHYPVSDLAGKYDASATQATDSPEEAYAGWPHEFPPVEPDWPL